MSDLPHGDECYGVFAVGSSLKPSKLMEDKLHLTFEDAYEAQLLLEQDLGVACAVHRIIVNIEEKPMLSGGVSG